MSAEFEDVVAACDVADAQDQELAAAGGHRGPGDDRVHSEGRACVALTQLGVGRGDDLIAAARWPIEDVGVELRVPALIEARRVDDVAPGGEWSWEDVGNLEGATDPQARGSEAVGGRVVDKAGAEHAGLA